MKKKIAIYLDYVLRAPNVLGAISAFAEQITKTIAKEENNIGENDFWAKELKDKKVFEFYSLFFSKIYNEEEMNKVNISNLHELFYNEEHYKKFLSDTSYILYAMAERYKPELFDYFNLIAKKFELTLVEPIKVAKQQKHLATFLGKYFISFTNIIVANDIDESQYDFVFKNENKTNEFTSEFVLEKLKELECQLMKEK